ncbi:hypothetical protein ABZ202_27545 [Streptomyces sp. NPDC006186]|uniref:hypothetical protein n=1 Tax=Streptomyces sp. NPDC006186 TaxID=3155248 RepID=UPI0033B3FAB1
MTTQTTTDATPARQTQGTHHFVITLEKPGRLSFTQEGTFTPPPGATRQDAFRHIVQSVFDQYPHLKEAAVGFFLLEPNQL